ncbi:polypyrimidine tract-binding protein homolog 1-like isoform X2 [Dioscorea cayenensis subsp. rotundata]|uniref:Polypyrimidine tract-binding protein homolog 1-like isoform X2 n=1 Tax=Dioscorea cayennensis subsp. rotundata TaxID=55577 RepID=A0AB40BA10_DIOCR|nr:polypyrimidine tract-binding protein homolog 1-like isoform X2 [Dioscorea cayenensis subsp. rotundata]
MQISEMSTGVAEQRLFRNNLMASKVLHLRNLPWLCREEELVELCRPFGEIVYIKCNFGANRNQAFVEFAELNQAISMVSYYASSSEPANVRGQTVYIQYSNWQEIGNYNKSAGGIAGNVLIVTLEGVQRSDVSIEVIHAVFSAYGYVHKIATFEKGACFQALIQFSNSDIASEVKTALNGRCIPRYLLPQHVTSCHLRISYSAHTNLNIKFQSSRSRDYTNPYLPLKGHSVIEGTSQSAVGPYGNKRVPESNVLLAFIKNMEYAVTIDVIHTVFSAYGTVQKIVMFENNNGMHALVQYPDVITAATAKLYLEGHCIYDGGYCKLHLSYSRHTNLTIMVNSDKSRDYTIPETRVVAAPPAFTGWQPSAPAAPVFDAVQMPDYDPSRLIIPASSSTYPGQSLMPHSGPAYPATGAYSSASAASLHASRLISLYGMHPGDSGPSGSSSSQPHVYYQ